MKSMIKDAAILFAITLIAGLLLGVVYEVTNPPVPPPYTLVIVPPLILILILSAVIVPPSHPPYKSPITPMLSFYEIS